MFTVDTDRIQAAASDMSGIAVEIESAVSAMHARLTSLEGSWTGVAASEFQGLVAEWTALQGRVREDLAQIAALTSRASGTYADTEQGVRGLFVH
jgi:6 kDa early secretory antigenic target